MDSQPLYKLKGEFFKTLGHPARVRILELLAVHDQSVGELALEVGIELSNLSQQLGCCDGRVWSTLVRTATT